jgi:hypothetical protein
MEVFLILPVILPSKMLNVKKYICRGFWLKQQGLIMGSNGVEARSNITQKGRISEISRHFGSHNCRDKG